MKSSVQSNTSGKTVEAVVCSNSDELLAKIEKTLKSGKGVKFTNKYNKTVKIVTEWNLDDMGDLTASYSTGKSLYVCPIADCYTVSEIELKDIPLWKN